MTEKESDAFSKALTTYYERIHNEKLAEEAELEGVKVAINDIGVLLRMHSYGRPAGTGAEKAFIETFVKPLEVESDPLGNMYKRIGDSKVLWSSHTDTVHMRPGHQEIIYKNGLIELAKGSKSNCLGADDTAGIWLMTELIKAKKPGLYIFHRSEESGGKGSQFIAKHNPEALEGIEIAIALDRYGTNSIITHQMGQRCASDEFAASMAQQLGDRFRADQGGTFTDTANYMEIIPECTNLSVGYHSQHTKSEDVNVKFLTKLRDKLLKLDYDKLVVARDPSKRELKKWVNGWSGAGNGYEGAYYGQGWDVWDKDYQTPDRYLPVPYRSKSRIADLLADHPEEIADWLEHYGIEANELEDAIVERGGILRSRSSIA